MNSPVDEWKELKQKIQPFSYIAHSQTWFSDIFFNELLFVYSVLILISVFFMSVYKGSNPMKLFTT